ncbi:hypothetical protein LINGRAHAP2_LOCUS20640, partial [Linum grandiflorum]
LLILKVLGYKKAIVESDSLDAVRLILEKDVSSHPCWAVIMDIKDVLNHETQYKVQHVFREANVAADLIAKLGHNQTSQGEVLLPLPPRGLLLPWH